MSTATLSRPAAVPAPFAFTPSRRNVFGSHSEMAHVWASLDVESGRSSDGRMLFDGGTVYSYGRHFKIAQFLPFTVDGRRVVLFTRETRSISTAKHIRYVSGALSGLDVVRIAVPDLSAWTASPDQVAAVWESLVRETASGSEWATARRVDAFTALYAPAAVMPSDPAAWVAKRDAEIAEARTVARLSDALDVLRRETVDIMSGGGFGADPVSLATVDASLIGTRYHAPSAAIARRLKDVRSALIIARKFPEHVDVVKAGNAYVARWSKVQKVWETAEDAAKLERERGERTAAVMACVEAHRAGTAGWREEGEFLRNRLADACRLGMAADIIADLSRAVALELALDEIAPEPLRNEVPIRKPITAAEWQDGAGPADFPGRRDYHGAPGTATMVRRKGDRLETSRGAVVPFAHAVTVYRAAALVRRGVGAGDAIGTRIGHYTLNAIAADGSITVGCHRIDFAEMERLACREVPEVVRARFPVPALI